MFKLSILIPSRNELFLKNTIDSILNNIEADTEIIVICDGQWPIEGIPDNPRLTIIHHNESIGQRAAINEAARYSQAKYVMKMDAHCAVSKGFDRILLEDMQDDYTMVPLMKNLYGFDWVCKQCGNRRYQGPTPISCPNCGNTKEFERDIIWKGKNSPNSTSYCFDSDPHFQYFGEFKKRKEGQGDLTETMSLQGSCWMLTRDKYFELGVCDESFGSWGSQGIEVALKTWLSGGRVICNKKTWYAHLFRTQGGDFSFPYPLSNKQVQKAKKGIRDLFFNNRWDRQILPMFWLLERFWPVPGWTEEELEKIKKVPLRSTINNNSLNKSIIFYTDNKLKLKIAHCVQRQLNTIHLPIVSASLKPMPHFGDKNIYVKKKHGYLTMFYQILVALEASESDIIFFCEHDVLYHPSHFDFIPEKKNVFYYNQNVYHLNSDNGKSVFYYANRTSQLCAYKNLLIDHYTNRIKIIEKNGFSYRMGFEPGTHNRKEKIDNYTCSSWLSEFPNIDIRHGNNLTKSKWSVNDFRNKPRFFKQCDCIPYWGETAKLIKTFL